MVKTAGRSFGRKKNYGLTVTVSSSQERILPRRVHSSPPTPSIPSQRRPLQYIHSLKQPNNERTKELEHPNERSSPQPPVFVVVLVVVLVLVLVLLLLLLLLPPVLHVDLADTTTAGHDVAATADAVSLPLLVASAIATVEEGDVVDDA